MIGDNDETKEFRRSAKNQAGTCIVKMERPKYNISQDAGKMVQTMQVTPDGDVSFLLPYSRCSY